MSYKTQTIPDLEERFLEPPEWRWHGFTREGRTTRFGSAFPKDSIPDAVVVCLPGLGEFAEKYFELARQCLDKNLAFWVIDWAGQGRSTRYLKNPHKRHGKSFQEDVDDLHYFVMEYIKHASVHPDVGRIPLAMLGHSMGANIGLRYLAQHDELFECAAFTAPMFGLHVFKAIPLQLALLATSAMNTLAGRSYAPGGKNWLEATRANVGKDCFSTDAMRGSIHNSWSLANPDIQVGNLTYGWLHHATRSCAIVQKKNAS
jgi:lysophospholipase